MFRILLFYIVWNPIGFAAYFIFYIVLNFWAIKTQTKTCKSKVVLHTLFLSTIELIMVGFIHQIGVDNGLYNIWLFNIAPYSHDATLLRLQLLGLILCDGLLILLLNSMILKKMAKASIKCVLIVSLIATPFICMCEQITVGHRNCSGNTYIDSQTKYSK